MSLQTPVAEQLRLVFCGLRNAGKSSLMNALFSTDISIVSDTPGTTTDPVTRTMELADLGPVAVTDTAGLDDEGPLGQLRVEKTLERLRTCDLPVLVTRNDRAPTPLEQKLVAEFLEEKPSFIMVVTHADLGCHHDKTTWLAQVPHIFVNPLSCEGLQEFKKQLIQKSHLLEKEITPLEGLVHEGDLLVLVTPIDLAAPKGRLILPQVETIRDALDKDCATLIVKERELHSFWSTLNKKPHLVVCDSQAFSKVAADIPEDQPMTSFSILFARKKGDLATFVQGVKALRSIPRGSKVLVLESCAHHKQADDIGTVKIPRLFQQLVQDQTEFLFSRDLPPEDSLKDISLVVNCAGCMVNRNKILDRLSVLKKHQIPVINYGLFLAWANGLLPRALEPFPAEYALYSH